MKLFQVAGTLLFSSLPTNYALSEKDLLFQIEKTSRIVGGVTAQPDDFPYFVEWSGMGCGGTLIHEDVVLTAAHCQSRHFSDNRVWVGSNWSRDGAEREIVAMTPHPDHDPETYAYDFMILKLNQPVVAPIVRLNRDSRKPYNNQLLTIAGFGDRTNGSGQGSWTLQEVDINQVPYQICDQQYNGFIQPDLMFCAGNQGKDSCQGDSGGPILDHDGVQVGVISFGSACGDASFSGVYSRVSAVMDWIDDQICQNAVNPPSRCPGAPPDNYASESIIQIEILYDAKPLDISWGLVQNPNFEYLYWSDFDEVTQPGLVIKKFHLGPGTYWFLIFDRGFDGIDGYVKIMDVRNGRLMWESDGNFLGGTQEQILINA